MRLTLPSGVVSIEDKLEQELRDEASVEANEAPDPDDETPPPRDELDPEGVVDGTGPDTLFDCCSLLTVLPGEGICTCGRSDSSAVACLNFAVAGEIRTNK